MPVVRLHAKEDMPFLQEVVLSMMFAQLGAELG